MDITKSGWLWLAGIAMAAALVPASTEAASFDCSKASAPHELAICSDPSLSKQDEVLATQYKQALAVTDDKEGLKQQQKAWIERTRACGADVQCLSGNYDVRYEELLDITNPSQSNEASPPEGVTPANEPTLPADAELEATPIEPSGPAAALEASSTAPTGKGEPASKTNPVAVAVIVGGSLALLIIVVGALLATKSLAERTASKYGWNMILNWWNVLYLVGMFGGAFVAMIGASEGGSTAGWAGFLFFCGIWVVMLIVNVRHTSLGTGVAITLIQPFIVFILWAAYGFARTKGQRR